MHPEIVQDGPGNCPKCGMNLVPVNSEAGKSASPHHDDTIPSVGVMPDRSIIYDDLNFPEIGWKLHYGSMANLIHQFLKITGLNPSFLKSLKHECVNYVT